MAENTTVDTSTTDTSTTDTGTTDTSSTQTTDTSTDTTQQTTDTTQQTTDTTSTTDDSKTDDVAAKDTDWAAIRTKIANGDEKIEKRLSRYSSVESMAEALIAAQNKIASGQLRTALPKDATEEQITAWREENGIPAKPSDYDIKLPDGLVLGESDQPRVDDFLKVAHSSNFTPAQVNAAIAWNQQQQEAQIEQRNQADLQAKENGTEELIQAWGAEYKLNKNLISNLIATAPEGVPEQILGGRLADGTPIGSHPGTLRWLADISRQINPTATIVPGSGTNINAAIDGELEALTKMMGDKTSAYWKGDKAEKNQARYRELVDYQQKNK